jgi:hypothetical protein
VLERENSNYKLIATMTEMTKSLRPWRGETGLVNKEMLPGICRRQCRLSFALLGHQGWVKALHLMLSEAGADDDDSRTEEFAGY